MVCADTLVHTWDLARAAGVDERLDPDSVRHVEAFLAGAGDAIRSPGGFGPALEPPAGADDQTRLLCLAGRAPERRTGAPVGPGVSRRGPSAGRPRPGRPCGRPAGWPRRRPPAPRVRGPRAVASHWRLAPSAIPTTA